MKDNTKDIINNLTIVLVLFRSTKDILKLLDEIKNFRILIVDYGGNKEILLKNSPKTLGEASLLPGMTPSAASLLLKHTKK